MKQRRETTIKQMNRRQRPPGENGGSGPRRQRLFMVALALCCVFWMESMIRPTAVSPASPPLIESKRQPLDQRNAPLPDEPYVDTMKSFQRLCPSNSKVVKFLFPHVNKAGGRSIEATFDTFRLATAKSMRHVTLLPRSSKTAFELVDGHRDFKYIAESIKCSLKSSIRSCELSKERSSDGKCYRWIFMLRNPVARLVSAFYTTTGRILLPKPNPNAHHFKCKAGTKVHRLMQDPSFSIEDYVRLDPAERANCEAQQSNLHVQYLAPDYPAGSKKQLQIARKRLLGMGWFGILERSEESMRLLSYSFGLDLIRYSKVSNVNTYDKNLSSVALKVLSDMNNLDLKLYRFANALFEKRMDYMLRDSLNQYYNPEKFRCDTNVHCWDKAKDESVAWDKEVRMDLSYLSVGEQKERILCSPKEGCSRLSTSSALLMKRKKQSCVLNFAIIGTRKGGTTSLYNYIVQHDKVKGVKLDKGAQAGEMFFFRRNKALAHAAGSKLRSLYNKAFLEELDRMHSAVKGTGTRFNPKFHLTGESSVGMGPNCDTPRLLKKACGDNIKMIYLARNPIERMISQYKMRQRMNTTSKESIEELIRSDVKAFKKVVPRGKNWWERDGSIPCLFEEDYLNSVWSGLYIVHISRWLRHFKFANFLVLKSEEFFAQPQKVLLHALTFLGIDPRQVDLEDITRKVYNAANNTGRPLVSRRTSASQDVISPQLRQKLRDLFQPYNQALATKFRLSTSDWQ